MMLQLYFIVVLTILSIINAQLHHQHLNPQFNAIIQNKAKDAIDASRSLAAIYNAANILSDIYSINDYKCNCDEISKQLDDGYTKSSFEVFYGIESSQLCNCPLKLHDDITTKLQKDLKKCLRSFVGAALSLKSLNQPVSVDDILSYVTPLEVNGYFKSKESQDDSEANLDNTKLVLQLLAAYSTEKKEFSEFAEKFTSLIPEGDDKHDVDSGVIADLLKVLQKKPKLSSKRLVKNADILLQQVHTDRLCVILRSLRSLRAVNEFKIAPIDVDLDVSSFSVSDEKKIVKLNVVNALGLPAKVTNIQVKSLKTSKDNESKFSSEKLEDNSLDLSSLDLASGKYEVVLGVSIEDRSAAVEIKKYVTIHDELIISNVAAAVSSSKSTSVSDLTSFDDEIEDLSAQAVNSDYLHISFTLTAKSGSKFSKPHQCLVRLHNIETGVDAHFIAKTLKGKSDKNGSVFKSTIPVHENVAVLDYGTGQYEISVVVADYAVSNRINKRIGTVNLVLPSKPTGDGPLYTKSLLHTSDNTIKALPEIEHQMRPPAKRANATISTVFTAAVVGALLVFIFYVLSMKPNFKKANHMLSLLFVGIIGVVLAMYIGYWFSIKGLSFYQIINYLCFMLPITYFVGRAALSQLVTERLNSKKSE